MPITIQETIIRQRIANVIKLRRKQLHLTQEAVGERCNRDDLWYGDRERASRGIDAAELLIIAAALECTPHDIYIAAGLMRPPPVQQPESPPPAMEDLNRFKL